MPKYLVTYNILGGKVGAKFALVTALKELGGHELFPDQWILRSDGDAEDLCNRLMVLIDMSNDGLAVIELTDNVFFRQAVGYNEV